MIKSIVLAAMLLTSTAAYAQTVTCTTFGNITNCSNGASATTFGNITTYTPPPAPSPPQALNWPTAPRTTPDFIPLGGRR